MNLHIYILSWNNNLYALTPSLFCNNLNHTQQSTIFEIIKQNINFLI